MISLRLAIVVSLCAVALWGLFSLLDNLREPELLRSPRAVVVKGCDPVESEEARRLCPELFCQKKLLDGKTAPRDARFEVTVHRNELIAGRVHSATSLTADHFACTLEGGVIGEAQLLTRSDLAALTAHAEREP